MIEDAKLVGLISTVAPERAARKKIVIQKMMFHSPQTS
jgi:hypothetical protein